MPSLNLPQCLIDIDEQQLPAECREKIAHLVRLGYSRAHMMISGRFDVHISQELAMLHPDYGEDEID
jgi:hypothetical protein